MKQCIISSIIILLVDIIATSLINVCNKYTVPTIAVLITILLICIAGYCTYKMCKFWILKLIESWNLKRKQ